MSELSIILPTCNRAPLLEQCLLSLEQSVKLSNEIIVVDGASTDDTPAVLARAKRRLGERLNVIREDKREGFVRGTNKGFRAATGRMMTWLNDDARPLPGSLDLAAQQLDAMPKDVAFVAMFHRWHTTWNVAHETVVEGKTYRLCHVRGTLYANFPVGLRATFQKLDYFDERYFVCAADPDLSLKAWHAGMRIEPALGSMVDHDELNDARRTADSAAGERDNQSLFDKWDLPPRNAVRNQFDPMNPCTLRGLRSASRQAA